LQRLNKTAIQCAKILGAFTLDKEEWGITELATYLDLAKSTVHGIVHSFIQEGVLKKSNTDSRYKCGSLLTRLGLLALTELEVKKISREAMFSLNEITGETIFLTMYMEGKIRVIGVRESNKPLRLSISVGSEMPVDRGACGKIWFACLSEAEKNKFKRDGKIDTSIVEKSLEFVSENRYATSVNEVYDDITAVAAPIISRNNKLEGIIVIGGLSLHFTEEKLHEYGRILKSSCDNLSMQLGQV